MTDLAIQTEALSKQYNGKGGCQNITLQVPKGVVYGFIGPNGAGKSTFVRTLLGLLRPTGGKAELLGKPLGDLEARRKIGYLPELFRYPDWLTGLQLLHTHADLLGLKSSLRPQHFTALLEKVCLSGREKEKIAKYSKGMQQRIGLACALLGDPELIFLDEPTSALDPLGRMEVRSLLAQLKQEGRTVFLNSHLLQEIETVCDQVAIIDQGKLITQGDWRKLCRFQNRYKLIASGLDQEVLSDLPYVIGSELRQNFEPEAGTALKAEWQIEIENTEELPSLVRILSDHGIGVYELTPLEPHLEEIFLYWMNRKEPENVDHR
ncbi:MULTISPECIES: ABC transporter ATP-binding protein [Dehalobacter]|jgi:ABC-2 type transport system ATP-binding protein|uniref:ATP-binding cassette domain-containing protein n=1 Tax=Dehalobacter restrictus TaxID=55583 RepID=A0A857DH84_9FIRM|nr:MULTISPECIES: ABC transporter ATP-binding protein [Dehalobacter]MCG1025232.1 ABC transporter ATP-binding protein [Dehalobacter sp.]MDJ0305823.1 ABC transporter ATP-binding protein [Dehalobacter sp.]OCZ52274.1 multidrug ABC transporter ATP-binding protein [Dehalobacter sp. TeCB1]QGZ99851.1 ATP-binding cassette domain-containing protein [Dehalobacter restrictus]